MSKNLTRKGLAFGAIVALGASLLNAAPAFAADELTLAPVTGTAYATISGESFTLLTGLAPSTAAGNTVQLKYQVVSTTATGTGNVTVTNGTQVDVVGTSSYADNGVTQDVTNAKVYASTTASAGVGAVQKITLKATAVSGTASTAKVTAFFDANNDGKLNTGEYSSAERTITWKHTDDITPVVTIDPVTVGDTTASAKLSFTGLNNSQIPVAHVGLYFTNNGTALTGLTTTGITTAPFGSAAITSAAAGAGAKVLTYSSTKDAFVATTAAFTAVSSTVNTNLKVQALYLVTGAGISTPAITDTVGTAATLTAVARTINSIDVVATGVSGVAAGAAVQAVPGTAGSLAVAASNAKGNSVKIVATVKDNASTPAVVANAAFKVTLNPTGTEVLSSTNSISVNGTAYTAAATAALDVTTDASGQITLTVANATALAAGTYDLVISAQNITNTVTITYAAPSYTIYDTADVAGSVGRTIVKGGAFKLDYKVLDQFGDAPSVSSTKTFRLVDTVTGTTATANGGTYYSTIAADGAAGFSFTDNSTVAGSGAHVITIQNSSDNFANASAVAGTITDTVVIKATAAEVTAGSLYFNALGFSAVGVAGATTAGSGQASLGAVTQTAGAAATFAGSANLSSTAFAAYDGRFAKTSAPTLAKGYLTAPTQVAGAWTAGTTTNLVAGDAKITIPVVVKDSTVAKTAIDGASVTVAAKGFMFVVTAGGKTITGLDSLTFLADATGTSVDVYSHVTGEQSIVFTAGAATLTQKVTFVNYGTEVAAVALGTLPAQAQAGSTVSVSAVATDKWGNVVPGVQIAFSNTGAGYVQDTAAQVTDSKGAAAGRVIVLQNDLGTSYITATAAKAKTLLTADLASAKSVEFGLVDADVVAGGHRVFVNAEFAKGRTITVTIDGKRLYSKVQTSDNAVELAFTQKKMGAHTVTVRISGGIAFTEKVTTN